MAVPRPQTTHPIRAFWCVSTSYMLFENKMTGRSPIHNAIAEAISMKCDPFGQVTVEDGVIHRTHQAGHFGDAQAGIESEILQAVT